MESDFIAVNVDGNGATEVAIRSTWVAPTATLRTGFRMSRGLALKAINSWIGKQYLKGRPWRKCPNNHWISWVFIDECPELVERIRIAGGSFSLAGFIYEKRKDRRGVERFVVRFPARQKKPTEKAAV